MFSIYITYNIKTQNLSDFNIISLDDTKGFLTLSYSKSKNAKSYTIDIIKDNEIIKELISDKEEVEIDYLDVPYNSLLDIKVTAHNIYGSTKLNSNKYTYLYNDATFKTTNKIYPDTNKDFYLEIDGYKDTKEYKLVITDGHNNLYETKLTSEYAYIDSNKLKKHTGRLTAMLINSNNRVTSSFTFYVNIPIVSNLYITSPNDNYTTRYNDVRINLKGGKNANNYKAIITNITDNIVNTIKVSRINDEILIPSSNFQENKSYNIEIHAIYEDYEEISSKASININMGIKESMDAPIPSHNPYKIKKGTKVSLITRKTDEVKIYYTLDGSNPNTSSFLYTEPIEIDSNIILKTYAQSNNRYDSAIKTYKFNIDESNPIIYLSPSNQDGNYGITKYYGTEMYQMNLLTDEIEKILRTNNITVYRNNPKKDINYWNSESNYYKADLHLAIHSNASSSNKQGQNKGPTIFIDNENSNTFGIAKYIVDNVWSIYPYNYNENYYHGVEYSHDRLGEANDLFVRNGTLIEIAYHDNVDDANWIVDYRNEIAKVIAECIIKYYN